MKKRMGFLFARQKNIKDKLMIMVKDKSSQLITKR
jgi:hypothetical protein